MPSKKRVVQSDCRAGLISRREFIKDAGVLAGSLAICGLPLLSACREAGNETVTAGPVSSFISGIIYSPDTLRENRLPPGQAQVATLPTVQGGSVPSINPDDWSFSISGLIDKDVKLKYADFAALPRVRVYADAHCVTGWSHFGNLWEGPGAKTIVSLVNLKPEAKFVVIQADSGFTTNLSLDDFLEADVLFAMKLDEEPLLREHGSPVRFVVPRLYFWKSAKWVTGVEFTAEDHPGFWERDGYNNHGDPWKEERYQPGIFG
jgi:DMSO/TMAO reductase YedYZ molybdopterin-dependent catalytic subunit